MTVKRKIDQFHVKYKFIIHHSFTGIGLAPNISSPLYHRNLLALSPVCIYILMLKSFHSYCSYLFTQNSMLPKTSPEAKFCHHSKNQYQLATLAKLCYNRFGNKKRVVVTKLNLFMIFYFSLNNLFINITQNAICKFFFLYTFSIQYKYLDIQLTMDIIVILEVWKSTFLFQRYHTCH